MPITIKTLTELKESGLLNITELSIRSGISTKTLHSKIARQTELTEDESTAIVNTLKELRTNLSKIMRRT